MIYLLVGYMWLFIHRPFEVWPWLGELRIERIYMLATIAYWAVAAPKTWLSCRSNVPVFLLAVTFLLASLTSPYAGFAYVDDWFKLLIFYLLVITSLRSEKELRIMIISFVCFLALYEFHSLREFLSGRHVYRMGVRRMVGVDITMSDPNSFGATIIYSLPFLYPVWILTTVRWHKLAMIGMLALGVVCILLTGSRSAFAGLLMLGIVTTLMSPYRWRILLAIIVATPIIWVNLRPDLQNRYMTLIDPSYGPKNAQGSAEGRTHSFWDGMQSFIENPLTGAGLGSYRAKTGFATHNVYNEAMGELGLPGLLVLLGFGWAYAADYFEARRLWANSTDPDELFLYRVCFAAVGMCLLLFILGYGAHNMMRYNWLWCGAFSGAAASFLRQRVRERAGCLPAETGSPQEQVAVFPEETWRSNA